MYYYNFYLTGSKSLSFIENSNKDTDILILSNKPLDRLTAHNVKQYVVDKYNYPNIDCRFASVNNNPYIYYYQLNYMKLLGGDNIFEVESIFNLKEEIINDCLYYVRESLYHYWYHVLINIYIFENNSYDFTQEQIKEINTFYKNKKHSNYFTDDIKNYLLDKLNGLKLNL